MFIENRDKDNIQNENKIELNEKLINEEDLNKDQESLVKFKIQMKKKLKKKFFLILFQIIEIFLEYAGIVNYKMKSDSDMNEIFFFISYIPSVFSLIIMIYSLLSNSRCNIYNFFELKLFFSIFMILIFFFTDFDIKIALIVCVVNFSLEPRIRYILFFALKLFFLFIILHILYENNFIVFVSDIIIHIIIIVLAIDTLRNDNNDNNNKKNN